MTPEVGTASTSTNGSSEAAWKGPPPGPPRTPGWVHGRRGWSSLCHRVVTERQAIGERLELKSELLSALTAWWGEPLLPNCCDARPQTTTCPAGMGAGSTRFVRALQALPYSPSTVTPTPKPCSHHAGRTRAPYTLRKVLASPCTSKETNRGP